MTWPAFANAPSISPATDESSPENTSFGAPDGVGRIHRHLRDVVQQRHRQPPGARVAIRLAGGPFARAEPAHLEPRMVREQAQ